LAGQYGTIDGIDPDPAIAMHPLLGRRWNSPFEASAIPEKSYDLACAYNVPEHIPDPKAFFSKVCGVLKDNGVFWALNPNGHHPFPILRGPSSGSDSKAWPAGGSDVMSPAPCA
jgi:SAM-dependent methyltransferase